MSTAKAAPSGGQPAGPSGSTPPALPGADVDWDQHADMYARMSELEAEATNLQLDAIPTLPTDRVLDIGCGPGRIAIPLAKRVREVTALDCFPRMLDACRRRVRHAGVQNVTFSDLDWRDVRPGENLSSHDVVICSRTAAMGDLARVCAVARRVVAVTTFANGPSIPTILDRIYAGTGAERLSGGTRPDRGRGFNVMFNTIYDLGYDPSVAVVPDFFTRTFPDLDAAVDYLRPLRQMPTSRAAEEAFRANVEQFCSPTETGAVRFYVQTQSVVFWWRTDPVDLYQQLDEPA